MTISLSGNPIIKHEARSQWRRGRAYWLLLIYAVLLAGLTVHLYQPQGQPQMHAIGGAFAQVSPGYFPPGYPPPTSYLASPYSTQTGNGSAMDALAQNGRETFRALATLQAALWLLITPVLTATSIASEREAGLLEALLLSRLRAGQIVGGKLIACLWLVLLMILAALPPLSICFLMGGVAPEEFLRAAVVQLGAAISGASIGLFFSARSMRPSWAMGQTFAVIALWSIGAYFSFFSLRHWMVVDPMWETFQQFIAITHPVSVLQTVLGVAQPRFGRPFGPVVGFSPDESFALFIGIQTLLCFLLLVSATRATARALPAAMWIDRDRWTDRLRARWEAENQRRARQRQVRAAASLNEDASQDRNGNADSGFVDEAKMVLLAEFPIEKFVRFRNPVLRREVRHKFRWRKATLWVAIGRASLFLAAACIYVFGLFFAFENSSRGGWWIIAALMLLVQTPALAFMAASSFSREREAGTWEGLSLSTLRPAEVLWGKLAAPLVTLFYYSVPFWPIIVVPIVRTAMQHPNPNALIDAPVPNQVAAVMTSLAILAASAFSTTALALLLSWLCRKTVTAVSWTIVSLIAFNVGLPMLLPRLLGVWQKLLGSAPAYDTAQYYGSYYSSYAYYQSEMAQAVLYPWRALQNLGATTGYGTYTYAARVQELLSPMTTGWFNALFHCTMGAVLLAILLLTMRRSVRERDRFQGRPFQRQTGQPATPQATTAQAVTATD
ncbi:MAG: type transport system permease protein [Abditibacteriota bacterium]|nr:type transport system permease protein [Abditibacteriota bacterium]